MVKAQSSLYKSALYCGRAKFCRDIDGFIFNTNCFFRENGEMLHMKFILLISLLLLSGCSTTYDQTLPEGEQARDRELLLRGVNDPIEPFNRTMFYLNSGLFEYGIYPASKAYNYVMPGVARRGLSHFYQNLLFPVRIVNNVLQGQWDGAW